ncbi:MAG: rhodanese-like domain-containing protein [Calditrichia bacterium]|nr:rhodanese-like domain-containing protein [Calditrichia bacterium]
MRKIDLLSFRKLERAHPDLLRIDIRSHEEWNRFHIVGFKHIPFEMLDLYFMNIAIKTDHIVFLCEDGERSVFAANMARKILPDRKYYVLEKGINNFK